eukprot:10561036-Alexandrium_andersonii.AAC.1
MVLGAAEFPSAPRSRELQASGSAHSCILISTQCRCMRIRGHVGQTTDAVVVMGRLVGARNWPETQLASGADFG